jgi:hypothetical protein
MNKELAYERAAKVLFYGSLDEPFALKKAIHAIRENSDFEQLTFLHELLEKKQNPTVHVHLKGIEEGHLEIRKNLRLDYWREFRFNSGPEMFFPILYKWIGNFSDKDIAELLNLSSGTLTMRYNEGLIKLGSYLVKEVSGE